MAKENRTKFVILGFLDAMPMSGYDIKKISARSIAHFWNEDYGHIYPTLRSLVAEGFAVKTVEAGDGKPDRHVYAITESGRKELARWLAMDPGRPNLRIELLLKVFLGARMDPKRLIEMLEEEERQCLATLAEYDETEAHLKSEVARGSEWARYEKFQLMSLRYGQRYSRSVAEWCRESIQELRAAENPDAKR